jgi:hypothetical protein
VKTPHDPGNDEDDLGDEPQVHLHQNIPKKTSQNRRRRRREVVKDHSPTNWQTKHQGGNHASQQVNDK